MKELDRYLEQLSKSGKFVLDWAIVESLRRGNNYLSEDYILYALTEVAKDWFEKAMTDLGVDPAGVRTAIERSLSYNYKKYVFGQEIKLSPNAVKLIEAAKENAWKSGRDKIEIIDLMIAIFTCDEGRPLEILRYFGIEADYIANKISFEKVTKQFQETVTEKSEKLPAVFKNFGVNLNALARSNKIPPIIGREAEIMQIAEILCHRERANSVMLVGDPGVGKTAVVEGLARKLVWEPDTLPKRLRSIQIINLQMNRVVAGTMFRGMFEERMQAIVSELKKREDLVLFVDEAHTIIGAGAALGAPTDAADILKSALARGDVRMIGATTYEEYKEFIAEDGALARRFRLVKVTEPTLDEARIIIQGLRPRLEENYTVDISPEAVDTALGLAPRYMRSLRLPDKVIGWLDTAAVKVEINSNATQGGSSWKDRPARSVVTPDDVMKVISQDARIPVDMIYRDTTDRFKDMEAALACRVIGQKDAINVLSNRLRLNKGPLKENFFKPDGVFLFLGPTGVGKTELAKSLAEFLFGSEEKMIRIDMSEYQDGTIAIEKLIGMPRGIVGSERGGILTSQLQENPYTVLLLDEVEKASTYLLHLFLQAFDEGWLTDGRGKKAYLSDAVVIMTSNLGSDNFKRFTQPLGFASSSDEGSAKLIRSEVMKEVERRFTPEFRNRIDEFVVFSPLTREEVKDIAVLNLDRLSKRIEQHGKKLTVQDSAVNYIVDKGFSMDYGARFLKRTIEDKIAIPLTKRLKGGNHFIVTASQGEIRIDVE